MGGFFIYRNLYVNWNKSSPRYSPYGAIIPDIVKFQLLSAPYKDDGLPSSYHFVLPMPNFSQGWLFVFPKNLWEYIGDALPRCAPLRGYYP